MRFLAVVALGLSTAVPAAYATDASLLELCRVIVPHVPTDDVAYRPGVDVRGKAVAPAGVGGNVVVAPPREIVIDLTAPLRQLVPGTEGTRIGGSEAQLGRVVVDRDSGEIRYNDQLLNPTVRDGLVQSCLTVRVKKSD